MKETLQINSKILELNEDSSNDIYMSLNMCILTNSVNLNNLLFTEDYINGIVENKDAFIGIPLVANRLKLENGLYGNLTHEFNKKTGELKTDTVGSFVDFWTNTDEDGVLQLMGQARIFKRYPNVCNAFIELFEQNALNFSCEVIVYGYESNNEETGVRSVAYKYDGQTNSLLSSCSVTNPAEPKSKASLLVAEALEKDLEGGENMGESNVQVFNKGIEIKYHEEIETSALKLSDVSNQIYNILNPLDPKNNHRKYNYYICDVYTSFVIVEDWSSYETLFKIFYKIENDTVVLDSQDKWIEGRKDFVPLGIDIDSLVAASNSQVVELNSNINKLVSEHEEVVKKMTDENTVQIAEIQAQVDSLTAQVTELNELVVSQKQEIVTLQEKETQLNEVITELKPFKEQFEVAEKQAKKDALSEKFGKLLSEEALKSEQVVNAIESLDEQILNAIVVAEVSKAKNESNAKPDVIVNASKQEDLIPQSAREKLYTPKSE